MRSALQAVRRPEQRLEGLGPLRRRRLLFQIQQIPVQGLNMLLGLAEERLHQPCDEGFALHGINDRRR
jgi:hypothetical protein